MKKLLLLFLVIGWCAIAMDKKAKRSVVNSENLHLCDWTTIFLSATKNAEKNRMILARERAQRSLGINQETRRKSPPDTLQMLSLIYGDRRN